MLDGILFALYFLKLRLSVFLSLRQTANPLDLKWRWKHWQKTRLIKKR